MGSIPLDTVSRVPEDFRLKSQTAWYTEEGVRLVPLHEGHLYVLVTREGHFAKMSVKEVVIATEIDHVLRGATDSIMSIAYEFKRDTGRIYRDGEIRLDTANR